MTNFFNLVTVVTGMVTGMVTGLTPINTRVVTVVTGLGACVHISGFNLKK